MMMRERERERELSDFSGCLAIATVGQKAAVGQGLPNILVCFKFFFLPILTATY